MQTLKPKTETLRDEIKRRVGEAKLAWQKLTGKKLLARPPIPDQPHSSTNVDSRALPI